MTFNEYDDLLAENAQGFALPLYEKLAKLFGTSHIGVVLIVCDPDGHPHMLSSNVIHLPEMLKQLSEVSGVTEIVAMSKEGMN